MKMRLAKPNQDQKQSGLLEVQIKDKKCEAFKHLSSYTGSLDACILYMESISDCFNQTC
jgi:hypothetical protein